MVKPTLVLTAGALQRRAFLKLLRQAGTLGAASAFGSTVLTAFAGESGHVTLPFENGERDLVAYPQKRPLILLTARPPQLETPFSVFKEGVLTPNDAFFVRYHWSGIPTSIDALSYRLRIGGNVNIPLNLSLADLKQMADAVDLVAVNQCSGNSRGHFTPRVNGGQLSNGAMGNARWTGIPLRKVLEKAGLKAGSVQVAFNGLDAPSVGNGPDFIKALNIDHALDGEVMLAWQMNGADLPFAERLPSAADRSRLLRHLLGEALVRHYGNRQGIRWILDEQGLSHSRQSVRLHRAGKRARQDHTGQPHERTLVRD